MKTKAGVVCALLALLYSASAFAHGGKTHIMGTLTTTEAERLVVKDRDGKDLSIRLTKDTKFQKGDAPAAAADLKPGDRVVIDGIGPEGNFTATEVRFSSVQERHSGHDADGHNH